MLYLFLLEMMDGRIDVCTIGKRQDTCTKVDLSLDGISIRQPLRDNIFKDTYN